MAGKTSRQAAEAIRAIVARVQQDIVATRKAAIPVDGRYTKATHEAFRRALVDWLGAGSEYVARLDQDGPALFAAMFPDVADSDAAWFATAWGWWAVKRQRPAPAQAIKETADADAKLLAAGDAIILPKDADLFVGDVPLMRRSTTKATLIVLGSVVVIGVGVAAVRHSRRSTRAQVTRWR